MASRRFGRWALLVGACLLALLLVEVALRVAGFSYPNFYQPDPVLGWALRPGEEAWWRREGEALVRIDAAGRRDVERPTAKPAGTWRLAVLGDSVVEALQVPLEETFPRLLERRLAACPALGGRQAEVLSFGVSGYGTAQELLALRHRVAPYEPDAVLLVFFAGNDVANNLRQLDDNSARPYFRLGADGELELDDSFREQRDFRLRLRARPLYALANRSRLLQLGKAAAAGRRTVRRGAAAAPEAEAGLAVQVLRPPADAAWQEGWRVTEALLAAIAREAAAQGAAFGVVTATMPLQAHPDPAVRAATRQRLAVADLDHADRRVAAAGERHGFPVLRLAPPLRELAERTGTYLHGFPNTAPGIGHWNAAGHAAAAERLAPWLCAELAPRQPASPRG